MAFRSIPSCHDDANMNQRQHRECVAERFVHHVPKVEHLLRAGQEQDPLGRRRLLPRRGNGHFQVGVARLSETHPMLPFSH